MVVSSSDDQSVRVWNLDGSTEPLFTMLTVYVRSAAFNSEGTKVVAGSEGGFFWYGIWVVEPRFSARNDQVLIAIQLSDVLSVAFTPDGAGIITGTRANLARVWSVDASTPEPMLTIEGHKDWVFTLLTAMIAPGSLPRPLDKTAQIWALDGDAKTLVLKGTPVVLLHPDRVFDATSVRTVLALLPPLRTAERASGT